MSDALKELATPEYFREEVLRFREVMCSRAYTLEQKETAFGAITLLYLNLPKGAQKEMDLYKYLADEWSRRHSYEVLRPLMEGFRARPH
jgi:hypothetical protein